MSNLLNHQFVSGKADGSDATKVQPSNWNAGHKYSGGSNGNLLVRDTSDATYGAKWTDSPQLGDGSASAPSLTFTGNPTSGLFNVSGNIGFSYLTTEEAAITSQGLAIRSSAAFGFSSGIPSASSMDVILARDAANTLAQRNGSNAQEFRLYGTTNGTDKEYLQFIAGGGATDYIRTAQVGAGSPRDLSIGTTGSGTVVNFQQASVSRFVLSGNFLGVTATGGLGYGTGSGGTVTQATSKATGVTLNTITGEITLNGAALAASTTVSFVLTDSAIAATDLVLLNHVTTGTFGAYTLNAHGAGAGTITIDVRNVSLGSLSEAIVIRFAVIKGATS